VTESILWQQKVNPAVHFPLQKWSYITFSTIFWHLWFCTTIWYLSACRSHWSLSNLFRLSSSTGLVFITKFTAECTVFDQLLYNFTGHLATVLNSVFVCVCVCVCVCDSKITSLSHFETTWSVH